MLGVEAAQQPHGRISACGVPVEGPQEELVELPVQHARIGERAAEHERQTPDARARESAAQAGSEPRKVAGGEKGSESETETRGLLGVEQHHGAQARVTDQCMASDEATAVVTDHGDVLEVQ